MYTYKYFINIQLTKSHLCHAPCSTVRVHFDFVWAKKRHDKKKLNSNYLFIPLQTMYFAYKYYQFICANDWWALGTNVYADVKETQMKKKTQSTLQFFYSFQFIRFVVVHFFAHKRIISRYVPIIIEDTNNFPFLSCIQNQLFRTNWSQRKYDMCFFFLFHICALHSSYSLFKCIF